MAFDGIMTSAVVAELNNTVLNGKIEKVYQPDTEELVFNIHCKKGKQKLYICCSSNNARMHLISETPDNPPEPSSFCMLLRKHLQSGRITKIQQKDTERIVEFYIETLDEMGFSVNKKFVVEIMGKHSNAVLVNAENGKIVDSIKRVSIDVNRVRQLLPGKTYEYPPAQDKIPFEDITEEQITEKISPENTGKSLLNNIQGLSPALAESIGFYGRDAVWSTILNMRSSIENCDFHPAVYIKENGVPADFHVFPLMAYENILEKKTFEGVSEAVEYFFINRESSNKIKQKGHELSRTLKQKLNKLYLKKQRLAEDLLTAQNSDKLRLYGELLTANIHIVKPGSDKVTVTSYYDGSQVEIPLDPRYSPAKNAQNYYKKYGKSKTAIKEKQLQISETDADIAYLESIFTYIENAETNEEIEALRNELIESGYLKKRKYNPNMKKLKANPHKYYTEDGFRVLVGRNNKENDILTLKTASSKDIWLHTKDIPGSHTIIFTEGREVSEKTIFEAAAIAAYHSKARNSENVPVDYVLVKHVKKPNGAKPGMVIFTHNKTVYVTPAIREGSKDEGKK